jgi:acetate kinase
MDRLGVILDDAKNQANPKEGLISHDTSRIRVAVIPTNEELVVASEVKRFLAR